MLAVLLIFTMGNSQTNSVLQVMKKSIFDSTNWFCRNNECPACRTHCASRRSLRDDPNYDALIATLYPDIDKYEEEVMSMLHCQRLVYLI
jgi:hypothetical protein